MTLIQYLCQLLSEECNELGQRASKLSRFGADEVQPSQSLNNFERLRLEKVDVLVIYDLLLKATRKHDDCVSILLNEQSNKELKVLNFSKLSVECGAITEDVYQQLKAITYFRDDPSV
jgi:hypothetical protein